MALDVYIRDDIVNVLSAVHVANVGVVALIVNDRRLDAELAERVRVYRQGYEDALLAVAVAFGAEADTEGVSALARLMLM